MSLTHRNRTNNVKTHVVAQRTPESQINPEQKEEFCKYQGN